MSNLLWTDWHGMYPYDSLELQVLQMYSLSSNDFIPAKRCWMSTYFSVILWLFFCREFSYIHNICNLGLLLPFFENVVQASKSLLSFFLLLTYGNDDETFICRFFFLYWFELSIRFPLFHCCFFCFFFVLRICGISESFPSLLHLSNMYML